MLFAEITPFTAAANAEANIKNLQAEAKKYPSEIARVKAAVLALGGATPQPVADEKVLEVLVKNGYARKNNRGRFVLTEEGMKFRRGIKKFGHMA